MKKGKTRILFVCKFNRFRSRIAESYFRKLNKNAKVKVSSAGIIRGFPQKEMDKRIAKNAKVLGIKVKGKPKSISTKLLLRQDLVIVVADDVPRQIFNMKYLTGKVDVWKVSDVDEHDAKDEEIKEAIKSIMFNVERLIIKLNDEYRR